MTSRRTMLGLLAVTPFVRPVIAEAMTSPKYAKGGIIEWGEHLNSLIGERCEGYTPFDLSETRSFAFVTENGIRRACSSEEASRVRREIIQSWDGQPAPDATGEPVNAPNRLLGAYINDDGDAV